MGIILSGVQPSGDLTLGNYLGAIRNWVDYQDAHTCFFCVVNLHALSTPQDPNILREKTREVAATYIACGVDPKKSTIFVQSHVKAHSELGWILSCHTPLGWLNRMTQFKDKAGKNRENCVLGLYAYPVLQAADILLYKTTHVPVGEDQKQHIELTRDIATSFNHTYGPVFVLPEPQIQGIGTRVMSLRDGTKKMSKSDSSDFSRIHLKDDADTIALKIRKAKTDPNPIPQTQDELEQRPEAKNLLTLYAAMQHCSLQDACNTFSGASFSVFKDALTDVLVESLRPISTRIHHLMGEPTALDHLLKQGAENASHHAENTLKEVQDLIGILRL